MNFTRGKSYTGFQYNYSPATSILEFNKELVDFEHMIPHYLQAADQTLLRKMTVKLTCGVHYSNAKRAKSVLESIALIGPAGKNPMRDAIE